MNRVQLISKDWHCYTEKRATDRYDVRAYHQTTKGGFRTPPGMIGFVAKQGTEFVAERGPEVIGAFPSLKEATSSVLKHFLENREV